MENLSIILWNDNQQPVLQESFVGEWVIAPSEYRGASDSDYETGPWSDQYYYAVARTLEGGFAAYAFTEGDSAEPYFQVCEYFEDMEREVPPSVVGEVASRLDGEYEVVPEN